ncbi:MAG: type I methionyl aminopeptidase [Candidatus Saccharimonadales bacterium]
MAQQRKTDAEIQAMREGGKILATILDDLRKYVQPGMSELDIDVWAGEQIKKHDAIATYHTAEVNFPGNICISVNDQIVHSVPSEYIFEAGDVASFDLVIEYKGMKTDAAFTMVVGEDPTGVRKHLLSTTERSLYAGIDAIKGSGTRTGDIGAAIEKVLTGGKLGIILELVGHGVGREMHMPPEVPNWGRAGSGVTLTIGDTIAIEPMSSLGSEKITHDNEDGWTISTHDGSLAAHFEHTVLITQNGAEILTQL